MPGSNFFIRLTHWEYWPTKLVYFPVFIYYLWLAIKSRSFFFFDNVNPVMEAGGLFGTSKYKQLNFLSDNLKPKTILIHPGTFIGAVMEKLKREEITFPFIAKPDKAERGIGVELLHDLPGLEKYLKNVSFDFIIQEYISFPFEAGVFYYRFPDAKSGKIPSIVLKEFLSVTGDGISSINELMLKSERAKLVLKRQKIQLGNKINAIPAEGERMLLEPIGNHNRGTAFIDGNYLINENLEKIFNAIANQLPDFHYGRFDLKAPSLEAFCKGEQLRIVEVNGVNAEPAHIYDASTPILVAWRTLFCHWGIIYQISKINSAKGLKPAKLYSMLSHFREWKKVNN
ncbi:MAG: hypothetical protein H0X62_16100 [Bacteroidetes bacterium]|nr:hypothetical protein [Bacteroidota bacterium]